MKDNILQIIEEKHNSSGGHCGTYATDLVKELGCKYEEVRSVLIELYAKDEI